MKQNTMRRLPSRLCAFCLMLSLLLTSGAGISYAQAASLSLSSLYDTAYELRKEDGQLYLFDANENSAAVSDTAALSFRSTDVVSLSVEDDAVLYSISASGDLIISGSARLMLDTDSDGDYPNQRIYTTGDLTVDGASVYTYGANLSCVSAANVLITNSAYLEASNAVGYFGIHARTGSITVEDGATIDAYGNNTNGVYAQGNDIIVDGGSMIAESNGNTGVFSVDGVIVRNGGQISVTGNDFRGVYSAGEDGISVIGENSSIYADQNEHTGVYANVGPILVDGGSIESTGNESSAILAEGDIQIVNCAHIVADNSLVYYGIGSRSGDIYIYHATVEADGNNSYGVYAQTGSIYLDEGSITATNNFNSEIEAAQDIVLNHSSVIYAGDVSNPMEHRAVYAHGDIRVSGSIIEACAYYDAVLAGGSIRVDDGGSIFAIAKTRNGTTNNPSAAVYAGAGISASGASIIEEVYNGDMVYITDLEPVNPYENGANMSSLLNYDWPGGITAFENGLRASIHSPSMLLTASRKGGSGEAVSLSSDSIHLLHFHANLSVSPYLVSYDANGATAGTVPVDNTQYLYDSSATVLGNSGELSRSGYRFAGWSTHADGSGGVYQAGDTIAIHADVIFYAIWELDGGTGGTGGSTSYTLSFEPNGGGSISPLTLAYGSEVYLGVYVPQREGYRFSGWYADAALTHGVKTIRITGNTTVYAKWTELDGSDPGVSLNGDEHLAYLFGFTDGTVRPESNATRAEVVAILYRLLADECRAYYGAQDHLFLDVEEDSWVNDAVATLAAAGVVKGQPGGYFAPDAQITRAEFIVMLSRFKSLGTARSGEAFNDISGHWAEAEIAQAAALGYLHGYEDGGFHPDQTLTRAELVAIINRFLGRNVSENGLLPEMQRFPDNADSNVWYYYDIQEATNSHSYELIDGAEYWTALQ